MSQLLNLGTLPEGTIAFTDFVGRRIYIGNLTITMEDFCQLVMYGQAAVVEAARGAAGRGRVE